MIVYLHIQILCSPYKPKIKVIWNLYATYSD